jgi:hypothetical protein
MPCPKAKRHPQAPGGSADLRLNPKHVQHIAKKMADKLEAMKEDVDILGERHSVEHHFAEAFLDDFAYEEEIEKEARELIDRHLGSKSRDSIDFSAALKKAKAELARKKGFTL